MRRSFMRFLPTDVPDSSRAFLVDLGESSLGNLNMSKAGALDLATGLGGKIDKSEVLSAVEKYILHSLILAFLYCLLLAGSYPVILALPFCSFAKDFHPLVFALTRLFSPCIVTLKSLAFPSADFLFPRWIYIYSSILRPGNAYFCSHIFRLICCF